MAAKKRKTFKQVLIATIRRKSEIAGRFRLRGLIPSAMQYEEEVDRLSRQAEKMGWGDDAYTAEEDGKVAAGKSTIEGMKKIIRNWKK